MRQSIISFTGTATHFGAGGGHGGAHTGAGHGAAHTGAGAHACGGQAGTQPGGQAGAQGRLQCFGALDLWPFSPKSLSRNAFTQHSCFSGQGTAIKHTSCGAGAAQSAGGQAGAQPWLWP